MTPALVLIPQDLGAVNRDKYLEGCIRNVLKAGYFPLSRDIYSSFANMESEQFVASVIGICKAVFLFIDFGMSPDMVSAAAEAVMGIVPVNYVKIIENGTSDFIISPEDILMDVSIRTNATIEELKNRTRRREVVDARFIYYRRVKEIFKDTLSLSQIGKPVNRDHATVIHGLKEATTTKEVMAKYESIYGKQ